MAVAAALVISQGSSVSAPGVTLEGTVAAGPVNFANHDNTNVARWVYTLTDTPINSALSAHVLLDSMVTNNVSLTPDQPGTYRVLLQVYDSTGLQTATDAHDFVADDTRGWQYPGFNDTDASYNQPTTAAPFGWKPPVNKILKDIHDHAFFLDQANGATAGQTMVFNGTLWVPGAASGGGDLVVVGDDANVTLSDPTHNQLVGFENITAPRSCALPTAPSVGQRITVGDTDGNCSAARTITLNPGAIPIGTTTGSSFALSTPYEFVIVEYFEDSDDPGAVGIWVVVSHQVASSRVPGPIITGNTTLQPFNFWNLVQANGETITQNSPVPGELYEYTHVPGGVGSFDLAGGQVTLAAGTGGFSIVDPQTTLLAPTSSVTFRTDGVTYRYRLDPGANVFRCVN